MISSSPISSTTGHNIMAAETFSPPHAKSEYGDIKSLAHSSSGLISPTTTCVPSSNMSQSSDGDSVNKDGENPEDLQCVVCSDKSSGKHYGQFTCEGIGNALEQSQSDSLSLTFQIGYISEITKQWKKEQAIRCCTAYHCLRQSVNQLYNNQNMDIPKRSCH